MVNFDVDKICRVCLTPDPCLSPLFDMKNTINGVTVRDMISECTMNLICQNDQLPDQICFTCIERLENAYSFKKLFEASHQRLLTFLASMQKELSVRDDVEYSFQSKPSTSSPCQPLIKTDFEAEAEDIHDETPVGIKKENEDLSCAFDTECQDIKYCQPDTDSLQPETDRLEETISGAMESTASFETPSEHKSETRSLEKADLEEPSKKASNENTEDNHDHLKRKAKKRKAATGEHEPREKPYECKICSSRFPGRASLNNHIKTIHNGESFNCKLCSRKFAWPTGLKKHMRHHLGKFQCKQCNECFGKESFLKTHEIEAHLPYTPTPYKCDECPSAFKRKNALNKHKLIVHTVLRPYFCICGKNFKANSSLLVHISNQKSGIHGAKRRPSDDEKNAHMYTKTEDRPFQCEVCLRTFSRRYNYVVHMKIHERIPTKKPTFPCPLCKLELRSSLNLEKHIANHGKSFQCDFCGVCFDQKNKLDRHERQDHGVQGPIAMFPRTFKNPENTVVVESTESTENSGPFECNQCQKVFKSKQCLSLHSLMHKEKNLECTICQTKFHTAKGLRHHMFRHGDQFKCSQCDRTFGAEFLVKIHERTIHPKTLFSCDQCSRVFKSKASLEKHKQHHAENRAKCKICEKLVKPYYIRRHMQHYHQPKRFKCKKCDAKFTRAFLLERHERHHTKQEKRKLQAQIRSKSDQAAESTSIETVHTKEEQ